MVSPPGWEVTPICKEKVTEFPLESSNLFLNIDRSLSQTDCPPCLSELGSRMVNRFPDRAGISAERRWVLSAAEKIRGATFKASGVRADGIVSIWIKVSGDG